MNSNACARGVDNHIYTVLFIFLGVCEAFHPVSCVSSFYIVERRIGETGVQFDSTLTPARALSGPSRTSTSLSLTR